MHVIRDDSSLEELEDAEVRTLIDQRVEGLSEYVDTEFSELVYFVIVQSGDRIEDVNAALGFALMSNRFDGIPYGEPAFTPSWEVLEEHTGSYEMVFVLSDDGAGVIVFVMKAEGVPAELRDMCAAYAAVRAGN